jgi:hypothetical protein
MSKEIRKVLLTRRPNIDLLDIQLLGGDLTQRCPHANWKPDLPFAVDDHSTNVVAL